MPSSETPVRSAPCCLASFPMGDSPPRPPAQTSYMHFHLSYSLGAHNPGQRAAWMSPLFSFHGGYEGQGKDLHQPLLEGFGAIPQHSAHLAAWLMDTCPPLLSSL